MWAETLIVLRSVHHGRTNWRRRDATIIGNIAEAISTLSLSLSLSSNKHSLSLSPRSLSFSLYTGREEGSLSLSLPLACLLAGRPPAPLRACATPKSSSRKVGVTCVRRLCCDAGQANSPRRTESKYVRPDPAPTEPPAILRRFELRRMKS